MLGPRDQAIFDYEFHGLNLNTHDADSDTFIEYENAYNAAANRPSNKLELVEEMGI